MEPEAEVKLVQNFIFSVYLRGGQRGSSTCACQLSTSTSTSTPRNVEIVDDPCDCAMRNCAMRMRSCRARHIQYCAILCACRCLVQLWVLCTGIRKKFSCER